MAHLGSGARLNLGAFRSFGLPQALTVGNRTDCALWFAWIRQDGATEILNQAAFPTGRYPPNALWKPLDGGEMAASIAASGSVSSADLAAGINIAATLTGSGDITGAALALVVSMFATLAGSGTVSGALTGKVEMAATLDGTGTVSVASLTALAHMAATLNGAGDLTAVMTALGSMSATITVTGTGLSTANVGEAVLGALVEAGFDLKRVLRIIAAATAGKNGSTALDFRDLSDTEDMIAGTFGGGKRTGATYGG